MLSRKQLKWHLFDGLGGYLFSFLGGLHEKMADQTLRLKGIGIL